MILAAAIIVALLVTISLAVNGGPLRMTPLLILVAFAAVGAWIDSRWPTALDKIALTVFPGLEGSSRYHEKTGK